MKKLTLLFMLLAGAAAAQTLPDYYPEGGLVQTGIIDELVLDESRVVIDDKPYRMNPRPIIRTPRSAYASLSAISPGTRVSFRIDVNGEIVEFWVYPQDYRPGPVSDRGDNWRR